MNLEQLRKQYPFPLRLLKRIQELSEDNPENVSETASAVALDYAAEMSSRPTPYPVIGTACDKKRFTTVKLCVETASNAHSVYMRHLTTHLAETALREGEVFVKKIDLSSVIARCGENVQLSTVHTYAINDDVLGVYNHLGKYASYVVLSGVSSNTALPLANDIARAVLTYYPAYLAAYPTTTYRFTDAAGMYLEPLLPVGKCFKRIPTFIAYLLNQKLDCNWLTVKDELARLSPLAELKYVGITSNIL